MSPFTPTGEQARWRVIYERLQKMEVDGVLTYEEMGELLDLNPVSDRHTLQMAMRRAALELEQVDKHAVDAVRGVGYQVVQPSEHLVLARRHQKKAGRSLKRGRSKAENVNFNEIGPETQRAFLVVASAFQAQMNIIQSLDIRQRNLETAVAAVHQEAGEDRARTAGDIAELRSRLEQLEQRRLDRLEQRKTSESA